MSYIGHNISPDCISILFYFTIHSSLNSDWHALPIFSNDIYLRQFTSILDGATAIIRTFIPYNASSIFATFPFNYLWEYWLGKQSLRKTDIYTRVLRLSGLNGSNPRYPRRSAVFRFTIKLPIFRLVREISVGRYPALPAASLLFAIFPSRFITASATIHRRDATTRTIQDLSYFPLVIPYLVQVTPSGTTSFNKATDVPSTIYYVKLFKLEFIFTQPLPAVTVCLCFLRTIYDLQSIDCRVFQ